VWQQQARQEKRARQNYGVSRLLQWSGRFVQEAQHAIEEAQHPLELREQRRTDATFQVRTATREAQSQATALQPRPAGGPHLES
tara:strand:- start:1 stop:252 length:252 start_codon:yes stop_codon:yes gene_type:complete